MNSTVFRRGMALPLTLIVLLVAGSMVGVSLFIIENMTTTTKMQTDDELRMNAALAGIEQGKQWVITRVSGGDIPRRKDADGDDVVTSADISAAAASPPFSYLVAYDKDDTPGTLNFTMENANVGVVIYDLAYKAGTGTTFSVSMPPEMRSLWNENLLDGMSAIQSQSYASTNRGGSSGGGTSIMGELGFYLIRSTASLNAIEKTIEQSVVMRK